jgi:hypothetical protein
VAWVWHGPNSTYQVGLSRALFLPTQCSPKQAGESCFIIGTACVYFPPSHPRPDGKTKWQEFKELDFIGAILFVAGLAVFLYGLNSGGNTYPWKAAGTLAPLILGLIVFLGAFIYDFFIPKDSLFPW